MVEPAEQRRDRAGIVTQAVPGTLHDPQFGVRTARVGERARVVERNLDVLDACLLYTSDAADE